jgi:hypothetical protein
MRLGGSLALPKWFRFEFFHSSRGCRGMSMQDEPLEDAA